MTFEHFVRISAIFSYVPRCIVACSLLILTAFAQAQDAAGQVGEVSLVLGRAYIDNPQRERRNVEVGSPIRVNDQIVTGSNGHVHIRFIDEALVSVRPDSQLEVLRYQYDARYPENSAVKFNLVEGITRSISGEAARSARQRFRLNTPIAAIGVRGTDFVVSASPELVRALVNEGTIVMAPYSEGCTVEAEGPCVDNAIELSGESLQIVELNADAPSATPATHERNPGLLRQEVQLAIAGNSDGDDQADGEELVDNSEVYQEGVTSVKVSADAQQAALTKPGPRPEPISDYTPPQPIAQKVLTDRQLVWGRWSWSEGQGDRERITLASAAASEGRAITIGNSDYGLYRDQSAGSDNVAGGLGVVGFALSSAQAFYSSASGIVAMQVKGGALSIDFERNTFATELNLEHATTGLIGFNAMGRIFSGGFFYDRSDTQNVVGAVSIDGKEAGYYFDRQLESGGIQGLTLWDSR
jgi:hypothetical protein